MTKPPPRKTIRDVTSSLVGSAFRRVYRDGRTTYCRKIMTLRELLARPSSSAPTDPRT